MNRELEKLKKWLEKHKGNFTGYELGPGGCETCGYGAQEFTTLEWDNLLAEIDTFGKQMTSKGT